MVCLTCHTACKLTATGSSGIIKGNVVYPLPSPLPWFIEWYFKAKNFFFCCRCSSWLHELIHLVAESFMCTITCSCTPASSPFSCATWWNLLPSEMPSWPVFMKYEGGRSNDGVCVLTGHEIFCHYFFALLGACIYNELQQKFDIMLLPSSHRLLPNSLCCQQASHFSLIAVFVCRCHLARVIQGFI